MSFAYPLGLLGLIAIPIIIIIVPIFKYLFLFVIYFLLNFSF